MTRAFGPANSTRSVRTPQWRQITRRCRYTSVTGCSAHGRSSHVRSRAARTRPVRRPHPPQAYSHIPRRSTCKRSRLSIPAFSRSTRTTRKPGNPKIHVQSRRDPTCSPFVFPHQERTTLGGPVPSGIASVQAAHPTAARAGGRVLPQIAVLKSAKSHKKPPPASGCRRRSPLARSSGNPLPAVSP